MHQNRRCCIRRGRTTRSGQTSDAPARSSARTENEEEQSPLFVIDLVEDLLRDERLIGTAESSLQPLRRLERHLDCHLKQPNREAGRDLAGNPETEILDD